MCFAAPVAPSPSPAVNAPTAVLRPARPIGRDHAPRRRARQRLLRRRRRDDAGLTATLVKPDKPNDAEAKLKLTAAADAAPGLRELRLVSPTGVSNPVQVWVEQYPLVVDKAPNTDPTKAQPIPLPAVITGNIDAPGDSDCYRFTARQGPGARLQRHRRPHRARRSTPT